jgi:hypothetical protein
VKNDKLNLINNNNNNNNNSNNLIKAVNTYAVPLLTYSFGVIKWYFMLHNIKFSLELCGK